MITAPGVYDIPAEEYHADPVEGGSLSRSEARLILDCPARYRWAKDNPTDTTRAMEFGTVAHREVLGVGPDLVVVDADDWRTKAAREEAAEAREEGAVPLLTEEYERVLAMAAALRAHPVASALFAPGTGLAEQTLVWQDKATGVMRRILLDWLPFWAGGRLILADYKSANSAKPEKFAKAMDNYGYDLQAVTALDGVTALGLAGSDLQPAFLCVVQEKDPPYLISVLEPDSAALMWARVRLDWALHTYRECTATNHWPAYVDGVELVSLPGYSERQHQVAYEAGRYDIEEKKVA